MNSARSLGDAASRETRTERAAYRSWSFAAFLLGRYASLVLLVPMIVIFSLKSEQFLTVQNFQNLLAVQSVVSCMAFAAVIPLIVGEFDLSLGYLIGFLAMIGAFLAGAGYGAAVVVPAMLATGVLAGVVNGLLTMKLHISSFIATLGTGILLSGATLGISGGQVLFSRIPRLITQIGQGSIFGLGPAVWLTIAIAIILFLLLEYTPFGRKLYAIGGSERVAFLAGVPVGALKIASFAMSGFLVGIGAIFALGQSGAANAGFGPELLLPAYAASFLSVITYRPGYYNIPGIVVAIIVLAIGFNGLNLLGAPFWAQPIFNGAVLLVAVVTARAGSRHVGK